MGSTLERKRASRLLVSRRRVLLGAAGTLAAGSLAWPARAEPRDRIVFALSSYPPSLRPWANTGTAAVTVKLQTLRGLLGYDATGELRGELAESWEKDGDKTWQIKLRTGATFHDGKPVDAEAVKKSFESIANEKSSAYFRARVLSLLDRIETPDPRTVRFLMRQPCVTWPQLLASPHMPIISPASTEASPQGAGPYRITAMERGTSVELEAFDGYYRPGRPRTKKLKFVAYQDEALRVAALEAGDVDISEYIPWQSMGAVEASPNLKLDTLDGPFLYLVFNTKQGPFANPHLREAVAYAINRPEIVKAAFFGRGSPLAGLPFTPGSPFSNEAGANHWTRSTEKAKKALAEGGQPNGFKTTLLASSTYGMHKDSAEIIQQNLREIGIDVTLNVPDWATRVNLGNRGQYEFAVNGTAGDFNDPDSITSLLAGGQTASYSRSFGYANPKIDELLDKGRAEFDPEKRRAIYRELETIALADAGFVGLAWRSQGYGLRKTGTGFKNLPGALTFFSGITVEDLAFA
ncbi:MAG: peptide ABC transporter substrate-binding protein [Proteobacteria bacterium]|nr:peptide ABC transporter substrate-binding protein [Pseudomonadota bacterium]